MRTEGNNYKAERQKWVTQPALFIRASYARKAGDATEYPFSRDFSSHDILSPTKTKLVCVKRVTGNPQQADPISGRSDIGTLQIDMVDTGLEFLKQVSDPARPLRLPIHGRPTVRNSNRMACFPKARELYGSTWTQSGFASFTAARMNDDDTETSLAFDADSAASGSTLQLDLGATSSNWKAFTSVIVYSGGTGANCTWSVETSDNATTWTTLATGFSTGASKVQSLNFPYYGLHRYWRLRKTNAATAGPDYYEVQFSEEAQGRNVVLQVDDVSGYPSAGHAIVENDGTAEDFQYSAIDTTFNSFTVTARSARGTLANDHPAFAIVRNGEQIRRGTRLVLYLGYQPMVEADFGPGPGYTKMEVQSWATHDSGLGIVLRCSDIQRFTKRKVFEFATETNPVALGPDDPITLGLRVLLSTGFATNGAYDLLARENGAAVPSGLVDVAAWESLRSVIRSQFVDLGVANLQFQFSEIEPKDAKDWFETQILRPLGIVAYVNQSGQYSGRQVTPPFFLRSGYWSGAFKAA